MAQMTYTITKADGTKETKSIEYTAKTMEEIFAEAAKLADGETSGRKFEDRLFTVARDEGAKKAQYDYIVANQASLGADSAITEAQMNSILNQQGQSNAAALNASKISIAADDKLAFDKINNQASAMGGLPAWQWERFYRDQAQRQTETQNIDNALATGNMAAFGGGNALGGSNVNATTTGTGVGGNNTEVSMIDQPEGSGNPPFQPIQNDPMGTGGINLDPTSRALQELAPYDVFRQYVATSPYSTGALQRAALSQYNPLYTQFVLGGGMANQPVVGENPFLTFLGEDRQVNPYSYAQLIRRAGDIAGMTGDQFQESPYMQDARSLALRDLFTGSQAGQYELAAANLPFQQMVGSPLARGAISNTIQNMYDRFRANYPLTTDQGQPASFLNYIRSRNLGGLFGTTADQSLGSQFGVGGGGAPALNLGGMGSGNV